jgi:diguanylate cyclase (GGDEF)-like protein
LPDEPTNGSRSPSQAVDSDYGIAQVRANLQRTERRDLWAWANAILVILGLTAAVVSLAGSAVLRGTKTIFGLDVAIAVRALVFFVLAFSVHVIYQHLRLRKLQRELAEQQIQAEVFRRLAMFDPLTGLYNRRFAEQRLAAEISRSERRRHPITVVLIDLNDFKQINDSHGHAVGDIVLKEFAQRLSKSIRGSDLAVRWGGDEFMLLLVDCNLNQLQHVLVRLEPFDVEAHARTLRVSFAIGWREYTPGDQLDVLLEAADHNLYLNKLAMKSTAHAVPATL